MITNKGIQHHSLYQLMHRFSGRSDQGFRCRQSTNGPSGDLDEEKTRISRRVTYYKRETGSSPLADEASDNSSPFDRGTHHRLLSSRPLGARAVSNKNRQAAGGMTAERPASYRKSSVSQLLGLMEPKAISSCVSAGARSNRCRPTLSRPWGGKSVERVYRKESASRAVLEHADLKDIRPTAVQRCAHE